MIADVCQSFSQNIPVRSDILGSVDKANEELIKFKVLASSKTVAH